MQLVLFVYIPFYLRKINKRKTMILYCVLRRMRILFNDNGNDDKFFWETVGRWKSEETKFRIWWMRLCNSSIHYTNSPLLSMPWTKWCGRAKAGRCLIYWWHLCSLWSGDVSAESSYARFSFLKHSPPIDCL